MPTAKTEATELAVGFGILDLNPSVRLLQNEIDTFFDGTLPESKYNRFLEEYSRNHAFYSRFYEVGRRLRYEHHPIQHSSTVQWTGPQQQAATASFSRDLLVGDIPISVKAESNVVANLSPYNLFISLPSGSAPAAREEHWFQRTAPWDYQELYSFVQSTSASLNYLPMLAIDFEQQATEEDRKRIQAVIKDYIPSERRRFEEKYLQMCHEIANISANIFNGNIENSLKSSSRSAILENLSRWFFRINAIHYILCGIDYGEDFSLLIPDITSWKSEWMIREIKAVPDLSRRQSVVGLVMELARKSTGQTHTAQFHSEIRWSHGRFCGNPEGKLYKDFVWRTLPFFASI